VTIWGAARKEVATRAPAARAGARLSRTNNMHSARAVGALLLPIPTGWPALAQAWHAYHASTCTGSTGGKRAGRALARREQRRSGALLLTTAHLTQAGGVRLNGRQSWTSYRHNMVRDLGLAFMRANFTATLIINYIWRHSLLPTAFTRISTSLGCTHWVFDSSSTSNLHVSSGQTRLHYHSDTISHL